MAKRYGEDVRLKRLWWWIAGRWAEHALAGNQVAYLHTLGPVKGPAVVVANHASIYDWHLAYHALGKTNLTPVVARYFFADSFKAFWLKQAGCIPKSVFAPDSASAIAMMRVLKRGGVLLLFPEAHTGAMSRNEPLPHDTASFIKRIGVPVYGVHIDGATLCFPKWGGKRKGGRIEVSAEQLYTAEDLKKTDGETLRRTLDDYLAYDDFQWLANHPELHYRCSRPAEHLERVVWRCPKCGQPTLSSEGDEVRCTCGFHASVDDRYRLSAGFATTQEWISWCVDSLKHDAEDPAFTLCDAVVLKLPTGKADGGQRVAGEGICTLTHAGLSYEGTQDGVRVRLDFPLSDIFLFPFTAGKNFVIYRKETCYIFCPSHKENSARFSYASAVLSKAI